MSISKAMNSAVSGVSAEGEALGVVGDNMLAELVTLKR